MTKYAIKKITKTKKHGFNLDERTIIASRLLEALNNIDNIEWIDNDPGIREYARGEMVIHISMTDKMNMNVILKPKAIKTVAKRLGIHLEEINEGSK